jgi:hypothetical protein
MLKTIWWFVPGNYNAAYSYTIVHKRMSLYVFFLKQSEKSFLFLLQDV